MPDIERGPNLGDQVYAYLRERIVSGRIAPGQWINESELAAELQVSRTPVSNAVIMLRERGLVTARFGRLLVPTLSHRDVIDLYRCRAAFDGLATRLAAGLVTDDDVAALARDLDGWEAAGAQDAQTRMWIVDLGFHQRIYSASRNRHLIHFAAVAADLLAIYRHGAIAARNESAGSTSARSRDDVALEHRAILAALERRDPEAAERSARAHVENVIDHLMTFPPGDGAASDPAVATSTFPFVSVGAKP